jgi:phage recombination protein Bet
MNAPSKKTELVQQAQNTALSAMSEQDLMGVLRNSLYPGAKDESIKLVIGYCRASGLDPMQKPVHIVPMSVSTGRKDDKGWDIKEMRDVVMPGIGLYRTQASRTGECAGITEPEFGDDETKTLGETSITFPKWCKVTVKRLLPNGSIVDFTAKELWIENYASKSAKVSDPNAMWKKRPYAQLAKCAEAQALRKAFPELGAAPTADEMEGKTFDDSMTVDATATTGKEPKPERKTMTLAELNAKYTKDKSNGEGVITQFSPKSLIERGEETAQNLIDFLSAKYTLPADVLEAINSWSSIEGEAA